MIRVFTHYVSSRTALLLGAELLMFMFAAYLGIMLQASLVHVSAFPAFVGTEVTGFALAMLFITAGLGVYQLDLWADPKATEVRMLVALSLGFILATMASFLVGGMHDVEHYNLGVTMLVAVIGSGLIRFGFYRAGQRIDFKRRVLVLGTGSLAARFAESTGRNHMHEVVGYVGPQTSDQHIPLLRILPAASGESLCSIVEKHRIDEIVVAVGDRRNGALPLQDLLKCKLNGVKVTELPNFFEREYRQVMLDSINPSWMIFGSGFNQGWGRDAVKRVFDLVASLILLILTLPVMLIAAICIILEDGMPVLYRQERVGQHGRVFTIFKFRSMRKDAERDGTPRWATTHDDRITLVGRVIRKLRIDELPQIINVLKGEMSLVGPRPERPFFVDQLAIQIPYYSARHSVKPGITGWAQVRYAYGASIKDTVEKLQYDLYYVKNHGLFLDLMTLIATVEVVLWGKGAR
jgi:sugar transferase (PEP-CTERM system associated)